LVNGYGPTEASVLTLLNPDVSTEKDPNIIGHDTSASHVWIVDPREGYDGLSPVGAVGELVISGPLIARGYLNDPEKTAQSFIENPAWAKRELLAGAIPPTRIYRTGDLARYRPDGAIEYFGRRDGQVKISGQRIELGEIESHLSADPRVRMAAVVQPKTGPCKKQLVGIVTLKSLARQPAASQEKSSAITTTPGDCQPIHGPPEKILQARSEIAEIQARLMDMLPRYMVPAAWIVLETMPLVVSGKLDRKRATRWLEGLDDATYPHIATSLGISSEDDSEEEGENATGPVKALRDIWAKELNLPVDRIKLNQPFLGFGKLAWIHAKQSLSQELTPAAGGDSIRAMGVVSRARRAKIKLSVQDVLRAQSLVHLAQLANVLTSSTTSKPSQEEETDQPFSLSPIQSMYMISAINHAGDGRFNQSVTLAVPPRVTVDAIRRGTDLIVERHAMLRARFNKSQDGRWEQRIAKVLGFVLLFLLFFVLLALCLPLPSCLLPPCLPFDPFHLLLFPPYPLPRCYLHPHFLPKVNLRCRWTLRPISVSSTV
jgi:hypothetical protein